MSDYGDPIRVADYKYKRPVYFKNPYSVFTRNIIAKLVLNSNNFNFELSNFDGSDFRLLDSTGNTFKMWKATWSKDRRHAVMFFKIPQLLGGASVSFSAYWGNQLATAVSVPDELGFLFYEDFNVSTLSSSKWSGSLNAGTSIYGYLLPSSNSFVTVTNPLVGKVNWVIEAGLFCNFGYDGWSSSKRAAGFVFEGSENNLTINFIPVDRITHDARNYTISTSSKTNGGLEPYSYNDIMISYYENDDRVIVGLKNRESFVDVEHTLFRRVEGDTRINNVRVYGREVSGSSPYGAYPIYINWFVIRDYDEIGIGNIDGSDLFIEHEYVTHQDQDYREYDINFINSECMHVSSFGGDPYKVSDYFTDTQDSFWISDNGSSELDSVDITFYTAWSDKFDTSSLVHYDSGHVYYYGAAKLSNNDTDRMGRNQWICTSESGWAAVKFNNAVNVSAFRIRTGMSVSGRPMDFIFYGSNVNPNVSFNSAVKLMEGTFSSEDGWKLNNFVNNGTFIFYILSIINTYGGNVIIDEWEMLKSIGGSKKKYPTQLRLHPATFGTFQYNFPKEISLLASNDGVVWDILLPWKYTYTPFMEHVYGRGLWHRYSFTNTNGYWIFRLKCRGNWLADDDRIVIGELSIHELLEETYTYRILSAANNNILQIWADEKCKIDDINSIIYISNDKLNKVSNNKLVGVSELPLEYEDFNVVYH